MTARPSAHSHFSMIILCYILSIVRIEQIAVRIDIRKYLPQDADSPIVITINDKSIDQIRWVFVCISIQRAYHNSISCERYY